MNTVKQMVRQPLKMGAGIVLIAIAIAVLCVGVGQYYAAEAVQTQLNRSYLSIALPRPRAAAISFVGEDTEPVKGYTEETDTWALEYAADHPEVIQSVSSPGLISAYIPELELLNFHSDYRGILKEENDSTPHNCAMFVFTVTEEPQIYETLSAVCVKDGRVVLTEDGVPIEADVERLGSIILTGIIDQVIGLQAGWPDPVGYTVHVNFRLPSEEIEQYDFQIGKQYMLYTSDYTDSDYFLRASLTKYDGFEFERAFEPDDLILMTEEEKQHSIQSAMNPSLAFVAKLRINGNNVTGLRQDELDSFRKIQVTVQDEAALPRYTWVENDEGVFEVQYIDTQEFITQNGEEQEISRERYSELYPGLTIVPLDGSAEDFLQSEEGKPWLQALENMEVNNHAFPVIGIDSMEEVTGFARNMAEIVDGREFTPEELQTGSQVCLISASLAAANKLKVGDVIYPQFYRGDPNLPGQNRISAGSCLVQPAACYFNGDTTATEAARAYIIIGIYQAEAEWTDSETDPYGFTPNTIFVPKTSVGIEMEYGRGGFYRNFIVVNGKLDNFQEAIIEAGFDGQFYLDDNGYSAVESSMDSYRQNVRRALKVGVTVYMVILLAYLLLFPARQGKTLATMCSLGTPRRSKMGYVLISDVVVIVPGILLGLILGILLWQQVTGVLTENAAAVLAIELDLSVLLMIATAAAGFQILLALVLAAVMSKE